MESRRRNPGKNQQPLAHRGSWTHELHTQQASWKRRISTISSQLQQILSNKLHIHHINQDLHSTNKKKKKNSFQNSYVKIPRKHTQNKQRTKTTANEPGCEQGKNKNWGYDIQHQRLLKKLPWNRLIIIPTNVRNQHVSELNWRQNDSRRVQIWRQLNGPMQRINSLLLSHLG